MSDIYGRNIEFGDAFKGDDTAFTFSGLGSEKGLLVQNFQMGYNQEITRLYELGSVRTYFIVGRPAGSFAIARFAGPTGLATTFISTYGNPCNVASNNVTIGLKSAWCSGNAGFTSVLRGLLLSDMGMAMTARDMMITENVSGLFASLEKVTS
jgi:hypothetical protein